MAAAALAAQLLSYNVPELRLDRDVLTKTIRTSTEVASAQAREWGIFVVKTALVPGWAPFQKADADSQVTTRAPLATLLSSIRQALIADLNEPGDWAENISTLARTWIQSTPPKLDRPTDLDQSLRLDLQYERSLSSPRYLGSKHAPVYELIHNVIKERSGYILKTEYFKLLRIHQAALDAPVSSKFPKLPVIGPAQLELEHSSLKEKWTRIESVVNDELVHGLEDAWKLAHQAFDCLLTTTSRQKDLRGKSIGRAAKEFTSQHKDELQSFDDYWAAVSDRFKKKGGRGKLDGSLTIDELDGALDAYVTAQIKMIRDYDEDVLGGAMAESQQILKNFEQTYLRILSEVENKQTHQDSQFFQRLLKSRQIVVAAVPKIALSMSRFTEQLQAEHQELAAKLEALKQAYYSESSATIAGRLEKCANREFKKRTKDIESEIARRRTERQTQIVSVCVPMKDLTDACLPILELTLEECESYEAEFLAGYNASYQTQTAEWMQKKDEVMDRVELSVAVGMIEVAKAMAALFFKEGRRLVEEILSMKAERKLLGTPTKNDSPTAAATEPGTEGSDKKKSKKKKKKAGTPASADALADSEVLALSVTGDDDGESMQASIRSDAGDLNIDTDLVVINNGDVASQSPLQELPPGLGGQGSSASSPPKATHPSLKFVQQQIQQRQQMFSQQPGSSAVTGAPPAPGFGPVPSQTESLADFDTLEGVNNPYFRPPPGTFYPPNHIAPVVPGVSVPISGSASAPSAVSTQMILREMAILREENRLLKQEMAAALASNKMLVEESHRLKNELGVLLTENQMLAVKLRESMASEAYLQAQRPERPLPQGTGLGGDGRIPPLSRSTSASTTASADRERAAGWRSRDRGHTPRDPSSGGGSPATGSSSSSSKPTDGRPTRGGRPTQVIRCSNCGLSGHESTTCTAGCRYCEARDHLSEHCPGNRG
ncbi:uncharacterized protein BJ171DRAFT_501442 [Polychytrium aggregatum]|uniref:uncharacterized protein n=1 Tax=Polychytrium aggregatum TaxID=110093 RepID=UPI0022FEC879|nr:uncharacterized protein BJ171DRAFT_501442 [Polychytrium aggregatum]KAI9205230.1 hypothetical protein BJ171DRAFT_501442 [Polychytrium aggregatum]